MRRRAADRTDAGADSGTDCGIDAPGSRPRTHVQLRNFLAQDRDRLAATGNLDAQGISTHRGDGADDFPRENLRRLNANARAGGERQLRRRVLSGRGRIGECGKAPAKPLMAQETLSGGVDGHRQNRSIPGLLRIYRGRLSPEICNELEEIRV
jgi:hypothetical protein